MRTPTLQLLVIRPAALCFRSSLRIDLLCERKLQRSWRQSRRFQRRTAAGDWHGLDLIGYGVCLSWNRRGCVLHWFWCQDFREQASQRRSDVIRKEVFTVETSEQTGSLYTSDRTQRIYEECLERARRLLRAGKRVIVDATFQREEDRLSFLQSAIDCGCRAVWLECTAPAEIAKQRIESRHGDASDADWSVYQLVSSRWQTASEQTERFHQRVETGLSCDSASNAAMLVLRQAGVVD